MSNEEIVKEKAIEEENGNEKIEENSQQEVNEEVKSEEKPTEEDSDESSEEPDLSQLLPDKMEDVIKFKIFEFRFWSLIYLGLQLNPKTQKLTKDMAQAKLAIDSMAALVEILMPSLPADEQRELKIMASDLKMNFISKMQEG